MNGLSSLTLRLLNSAGLGAAPGQGTGLCREIVTTFLLCCKARTTCTPQSTETAHRSKPGHKGRDSRLLKNNVHIVKAMVFSVIMYKCESWAIKEDKH